jgi:hypothetical protein
MNLDKLRRFSDWSAKIAKAQQQLAEELAAQLAQAGVICLISRRVPLSAWPRTLIRQPGDVKVTVDLTRLSPLSRTGRGDSTGTGSGRPGNGACDGGRGH